MQHAVPFGFAPKTQATENLPNLSPNQNLQEHYLDRDFPPRRRFSVKTGTPQRQGNPGDSGSNSQSECFSRGATDLASPASSFSTIMPSESIISVAEIHRRGIASVARKSGSHDSSGFPLRCSVNCFPTAFGFAAPSRTFLAAEDSYHASCCD